MKDFNYNGRIYYSPVELTMAFIGGTWKMPILLALRKRKLRYGELKNNISHITDKMLYSQLRELEKKGMIERKIYKEKPPRVDYYLTPLGKRSIKVIDALTRFGEHLMDAHGISCKKSECANNYIF
jgi:DNA-binding HxlR family transcriptional regulator